MRGVPYLGLLLMSAGPALGVEGAWVVNGPSRVRLVSPYAAAVAGELRLGLHVRLERGWHIYWKNSGDAGYPPAVTLVGAGVSGGRLLWPAPRRFDLPGGLVAFGYEDEVVYPLRARLAAAGAGMVELTADVDYVVCEVDCIPYRAQLALVQPLAEEAAADARTAPLLARWEARVPRAVEAVAGVETGGAIVREDDGAAALEVWFDGVEPAPVGTGLFFAPQDDFELGRPRARATEDGVAWRVPLAPLLAGRPLPERAELAWTVTGLRRDGRLPALEARREVGLGGGADARSGRRSSGVPLAGRRGLWLVLVAGLLLNLAPSVLALRLAQWSGGGPGGGRRGATAEAAGTLVAVAGAAALAPLAGHPPLDGSWGPPIANPAVSALLAVLTLALALDLWGMVGLPLAGPHAAPGRKDLTLLRRRAVTGAWAALLALAWTPPWLGLALAASELPARLAAAALLALGVALPGFVFAWWRRRRELRAGAGAAEPAPRAALQQALGFLAAAGVVWLLHLLARRVGREALAGVELALLGLALCAWLGHRARRGGMLRIALRLGLLACALAAPWLAFQGQL